MSAYAPISDIEHSPLAVATCHYRKSLAIKLTRGLFQIERTRASEQFAPTDIKSMI